MSNPYQELKELDYDAYIKTIQFISGLICNVEYYMTYDKEWKAYIEREIVSYTLQLKKANNA
jgi:hypothetical protein